MCAFSNRDEKRLEDARSCHACHRLPRELSTSSAASRGKGLQPRSLEVFDDLGIVERVLAHGRMSMPIRSTALDGQVSVTGTATSDARPDVPYHASLITPEWRTEEALRLRLKDLGGAILFGTLLRSFRCASKGVVATLVAEGELKTICARSIVGCDGGHSIVRKQAGIAFQGETREEVRIIVADLAVDGLKRDTWHMWRHPEGFVGLCPLPSTSFFQFQGSIGPGQQSDLTLTNMQAILE